MAASIGKAFIVSEAGGTFYFQFNPKEVSLDEAVTWEEKGEEFPPKLEFKKGALAKVSFEAYFDTTDSGSSVDSAWVTPLKAFMNASVTGQVNGHPVKRPPYLFFSWSGLKFKCVMEKCQTTYLMFATNGTPLRAKCQVSLKRCTVDEGPSSGSSQIAMTSPGSMLSYTAKAETRVIPLKDKVGKNASQIAQEEGVPLRDYANANNIDDPTKPVTGSTVAPGSPEEADVLARQNQANVESNTTAKEAPKAFGQSEAGGQNDQQAVNDVGDMGVTLRGQGGGA